MKIYKISFTSNGASEGFYFTSSLREARAREKNAEEHSGDNWEKEIVVIHITPTKKGIIEALNFHASHNDNG